MVAGVCGLAVFALLAFGRPKGHPGHRRARRRRRGLGLGVAQYPVLLPGTSVTLSNAGAPESTMVAVIAVFIVALVLVGPSFALLYMLQGRHLLGAGEHGALAAAVPAGYQGGRRPPPLGGPPPGATGSSHRNGGTPARPSGRSRSAP